MHPIFAIIFYSCLINKFGNRLITFCGLLLMASAMLAITFSATVYILFLCYAIFGLGNGMIHLAGMVICSSYFSKVIKRLNNYIFTYTENQKIIYIIKIKKNPISMFQRRSLAVGICLSGVSCGKIVMPYLGDTLLELCGWQWAFRIYSMCFIVIR